MTSPTHLGLAPAALPTLPVGAGLDVGEVRAAEDTRLAASVSLLLGAIAADHPIGQLHGVVLGEVVTGVAGVGLPTAGETEPAMTLLVVYTRAELREGFAQLDYWVVGSTRLGELLCSGQS